MSGSAEFSATMEEMTIDTARQATTSNQIRARADGAAGIAVDILAGRHEGTDHDATPSVERVSRLTVSL